jgi:hypothetical protein
VAHADGDGRPAPVVARAFASYERAQAAIRGLQAASVSPRNISVVTRAPADADRLERDTGVSEDLEQATQHHHRLADLLAWLGRVEAVAVPGFGAVLGTGDLWQDLSLASSGRGAITGALVGLGVQIDDATNLEQAVADGQILLVVHGVYDAGSLNAVLGPSTPRP